MNRFCMARAARVSVLALMVPMIAACDSLSGPFDAITARPPAPDEFAVLSRKPLKMPGSVALPEPRLGERSALEPDPETDAIVALLGRSAVTRVQTASQGEAALLSAANAASEQIEIRQILEAETLAAEENKPYEVPSLFDFFDDEGNKVDKETLINPAVESRRLQAEGVAAAPVDPAAIPEGALEEALPPREEFEYHPRRGRIITPSVSKPSS